MLKQTEKRGQRAQEDLKKHQAPHGINRKVTQNYFTSIILSKIMKESTIAYLCHMELFNLGKLIFSCFTKFVENKHLLIGNVCLLYI